MRSVAETESSIQVLMRSDAAAGERASPAHRLNRQRALQKTDGVVAVHRALELEREDAVQIAGGTGEEGAAPLDCRHLKTAIELGDVVLPQEAIGLFQGGASCQPQLLWQPP